jgi:hypothetical protein
MNECDEIMFLFMNGEEEECVACGSLTGHIAHWLCVVANWVVSEQVCLEMGQVCVFGVDLLPQQRQTGSPQTGKATPKAAPVKPVVSLP